MLPLRTQVMPLTLRRADRSYRAYLGLDVSPTASLLCYADQFLHADECAKLAALTSDSGQGARTAAALADFLRSRHAGKSVLTAYLPSTGPTPFNIQSGVFGQPLVAYPGTEPLGISLAHSHGAAAALAFSECHPMAVDLELITPDNHEKITSQLTHAETLLASSLGEETSVGYTRLWCIKEALAKVLKTGLLVPMDWYEIESTEIHNQLVISYFRHFLQYQAISFEWQGYVCAVVLPRASGCDFAADAPENVP